MSVQITQADDAGVVHARLTGEMTLADQRMLEALARRLIDGGGEVRLLLVLDGFRGWARDEGWDDDLQFTIEYCDRIARIAIVGDASWRDEALAFVGQGFRKTQIAYFTTPSADRADAWVRG
ncbi:STAS/SEC14 domain-containing protein [Luteimonas sp. A534]